MRRSRATWFVLSGAMSLLTGCGSERSEQRVGEHSSVAGVVPSAAVARGASPASSGAPLSAAGADVSALKKAFEAHLSRSSVGLTSVALPGGARLIHLKGRFHTAAVARVRPDGTLEQGCFDNADHAARFLAGEKGGPQ
jgi:hypothetical protein